MEPTTLSTEDEITADEQQQYDERRADILRRLSPTAKRVLGEDVVEFPGASYGVIYSGNLHSATRAALISRGLIEYFPHLMVSLYALTEDGAEVRGWLA